MSSEGGSISAVIVNVYPCVLFSDYAHLFSIQRGVANDGSVGTYDTLTEVHRCSQIEGRRFIEISQLYVALARALPAGKPQGIEARSVQSLVAAEVPRIKENRYGSTQGIPVDLTSPGDSRQSDRVFGIESGPALLSGRCVDYARLDLCSAQSVRHLSVRDNRLYRRCRRISAEGQKSGSVRL